MVGYPLGIANVFPTNSEWLKITNSKIKILIIFIYILYKWFSEVYDRYTPSETTYKIYLRRLWTNPRNCLLSIVYVNIQVDYFYLLYVNL